MAKKRNRVFKSERLRILENEFQGTQDDFAALFGMDQSQMNRYLTGVREPTPDLIKRFAEKFEVTTDWLLGLTPEREATVRLDDLTAREKAVIRAMRESNDDS